MDFDGFLSTGTASIFSSEETAETVHHLKRNDLSSGEQTRQNSDADDVLNSLGQKLKGSWGGLPSWGNILENVKKQSEVVVDLYKNDLSELISTVNEDIEEAYLTVKETIDAVKPQIADFVKKDDDQNVNTDSETLNDRDEPVGVLDEAERILDNLDVMAEKAENMIGNGIFTVTNNLTSFLSTAINIAPPNLNSKSSFAYNRKTATISQTRRDPDTYLHDPLKDTSSHHGKPPVHERFAIFFESFDEDTKLSEMSQLLNSDVEMKRLYTDFVPHKMSSKTFWARYFFRVGEIEFEEQRRKALVKSVEDTQGKSEELFSWDWDDEEEGNAERTQTQRKEIKNEDTKEDTIQKPSLTEPTETTITVDVQVVEEAVARDDVNLTVLDSAGTDSFELVREPSMQTITSSTGNTIDAGSQEAVQNATSQELPITLGTQASGETSLNGNTNTKGHDPNDLEEAKEDLPTVGTQVAVSMSQPENQDDWGDWD